MKNRVKNPKKLQLSSFVFILLIIFTATVCGSVPKKNHSSKEVMSVINAYSKKIKKEKRIWNSAYGLFYAGEDKIYDGKIHTIFLGYDVDENLKYEEARGYFYAVVDGLLAHINKNTQLENYFFHYPVDYRDLEIHFSFEDDKKGFLKKDEMQSIHIFRNKIYYEISSEDGPNVIVKDQISPDIYITKGIRKGNLSVIRTVSEDLAMHEK